MNRHIFVVTRLDHTPNETPKVSIAGSYFDKEQAYENALVLQLQQMIENTSNWPTQTIQRRRDKILNRCRSLPITTMSSYQSKFQHLFPTLGNLFDDLCNVSHQVHGCLPLDETTQPISTATSAEPAETPLLHKLMTTLQTLLNDEEDLAHSDGEDDDEDEGDEEDEYEEVDDAEVDDIDDDSEDEANNNDMVANTSNRNNKSNSDEDDEDEMDGSDDDVEGHEVIEISEDEDELQPLDSNNGLIRQHFRNNDYDTIKMETTIKPLDETTDNGNTNCEDTDYELVGGDSGNVTLLSPPHSDQKQSFSDGSVNGDVDDDVDDDADDNVDDLDEDEIDELNDDEDEAPNKRRRTDL